MEEAMANPTHPPAGGGRAVVSRTTHVRVWGYATDDGDLALTADPGKAEEWKQLFRERGFAGPYEFVLHPSARTWNKSVAEIEVMRDARRNP
jgi:hypothetical protein